MQVVVLNNGEDSVETQLSFTCPGRLLGQDSQTGALASFLDCRLNLLKIHQRADDSAESGVFR
jgi:hypothetical protein